MDITSHAPISIQTSEDVVTARQKVRELAAGLGLSVINQTKIITAASELARNMIDYGKGGVMQMEILRNAGKTGLKLVFEDKGPGIPDIEKAMVDGYTTGGGLGLGLSGARRLCNEFAIRSEVGKGTWISITQWK